MLWKDGNENEHKNFIPSHTVVATSVGQPNAGVTGSSPRRSPRKVSRQDMYCEQVGLMVYPELVAFRSTIPEKIHIIACSLT